MIFVPSKKIFHPARCYSLFLGIVMNLYNSLLSYILTDSSRSYSKIGLEMTVSTDFGKMLELFL